MSLPHCKIPEADAPPAGEGRGKRITYGRIQVYCRREYGFVPPTSWIASVLAEQGMTHRMAPNRKNPSVVARPCPPHRREQVRDAILQLGQSS
ncbi:hypothetical protein ACO2Q3_06050 [Caulobacter sp. KR2-114]|uniref:hypothetical protein n=1 Tax=Caulobacter sp. KR2-114 TaxID=3400912 RepID=UPI003C115CF0